jgi:hypothetical protein
VQDDYDLETWDFVFMPSVVEATPRKVESVTEQEQVPKQAPAAAKPAAPKQAAPAPETKAAAEPSIADWQKAAEALVRDLEDTVAGRDVHHMAEILPSAIDTVDQFSSSSDEEAVKLRSQITALVRVLATRISDLVAAKPQQGSQQQGAQQERKDEMSEKKPEVQELVAKFVKENRELQQKVAALQESSKGSVPAVRYSAAKRLIAGMTENLRREKALRVKAERKLEAAIKLLHKVQNETVSQTMQEQVDALVKEHPELAVVRDDLVASANPQELERKTVTYMKLAGTTPAKKTKKEEQEPKKGGTPPVQESKAPVQEAPKAPTPESVDRARRIREGTAVAPVAGPSANLMDAYLGRK